MLTLTKLQCRGRHVVPSGVKRQRGAHVATGAARADMRSYRERSVYGCTGPWGGDGGARGGTHDGAAAVRFRRTLVAGGGFARTAEDRVP